VESGQTFTSTDAVFTMSDRLTVKAQVDETDISQIQLKQKANITLDAYPNQIIPAHVDQIAYDSTTVNNVTTYTVDVLPEVTPEFMRSGMTANVTFDVASKKQILVVPVQAFKVKNEKYYVQMKPERPGLEPEEREVQTGLTDGKRTEIVSGLSENEVVVVAEINSTSKQTTTQNPLAPNRSNPHGRSRS
jgi:macrolide-specific efflux system membrane fusion protein